MEFTEGCLESLFIHLLLCFMAVGLFIMYVLSCTMVCP